ncbi:hypothetical protein TNCV_4471271 [Trichonephila clavipes]|uniref:Uncharacterized protein n=1 Tax=Trichonephila clavipes TaxID=2585209 RepID=A0A8X6SDE9_TRICX|nr:hypothetical protein TNCV_4471271 [Trichonephila clavipes]
MVGQVYHKTMSSEQDHQLALSTWQQRRKISPQIVRYFVAAPGRGIYKQQPTDILQRLAYTSSIPLTASNRKDVLLRN